MYKVTLTNESYSSLVFYFQTLDCMMKFIDTAIEHAEEPISITIRTAKEENE